MGSPFPAGGRGRGLGAAAALILFLPVVAYFAAKMVAMILPLTGPVSRDQIASAKSPDGRTRAILIETNGGATTPYGYFVELEHQGQAPVRVARLVSAGIECARGVDLEWSGADLLVLHYTVAGDVEVTPTVTFAGRTIRVVARQEPRNPVIRCN